MALWAASACSPGGGTATPVPPRQTSAHPQGRAVSAALERYDDCPTLVAALRREALEEVGPYGLQGPGYQGFDGGSTTGGSSTGTAGTTGTTGGAPVPQTGGFSGTNNQEDGVDEPDLVKTDGQLMAIVSGVSPRLELLDVSGPRPVQLSSFPLDLEGPRLLLSGQQVIVLGAARTRDATSAAEVIDVRTPTAPRLVRRFAVAGELQDARLEQGRLLVVVRGNPPLHFPTPAGQDQASLDRATAANRAIITRATAADFLPAVRVSPGDATYPTECSAALLPTTSSGLGLTSILSLDPAHPRPTSQLTLVATTRYVYASTTSLYLATSAWQQTGTDPSSTQLHGFDLADPTSVRYVGSGSVAGTLTDQYALSEDHGYLRVASTVTAVPDQLASSGTSSTGSVPPLVSAGTSGDTGGSASATGTGQPYIFTTTAGTTGVTGTTGTYSSSATSDGTVGTTGDSTGASTTGDEQPPMTDSRVTVLTPTASTLTQVGLLTGLGTGERIYGVRFLGSTGYVVTFRQTDPLYVLDLSDPRHPRRRGELALTGFSSALYPLGTGRLLGIGQGVNQLHQTGVQLSTFDTAQASSPRLLDSLLLPDALSDAESDHHALLWWPAARDLVLPLGSDDPPFQGAVVLNVGPDGTLTESGRISPPNGQGVQRAVVVNGLLYSISRKGIVVSPLANLKDQAWLPYR